MNNELKKQLEATMPEVPDSFHQAMCRTLQSIADEQKEANDMLNPKTVKHISRSTIILCFIAALLVTSVAAAVTLNTDLFMIFLGKDKASEAAPTLIQYDLAHKTVGQYEIDVREAAYDGMSLFVCYSLTDTTATEPLDTSILEDPFCQLEGWDVGWWHDGIWINGVDCDIMGGSTALSSRSDKNGEWLCYMLFRLDQSSLQLSGSTTISLPIAKAVPFDALQFIDVDGEMQLLCPEEGTVTFTLDCSRTDGIKHLTPNIDVSFPNGNTARVTRADFTPLKLYVKLSYEIPELPEEPTDWSDEAAVNAYFEASSSALRWVNRMALVDEQGQPVFTADQLSEYDGCESWGDHTASFVFPYSDQYPKHMYLAVMENGKADMQRAVQIR